MESPKVSTAQRMTALAGADSNPLLITASSSAAQWLLAHVGLGHRSSPSFRGDRAFRGPPPALDARPNAGFSIHDQTWS